LALGEFSMDGAVVGCRKYDSDLRDDEWALIAPYIPGPKPGGRARTVDIRAVVNAIFYLLKTGCQWRALPHDYPPWPTVNWYWNQWRDSGLWRKLNDILRRDLRSAAGRHDEPSAGVIDSQTLKSAEKGGRAATTPGRTSQGANVTP
jgi:putative transposase